MNAMCTRDFPGSQKHVKGIFRNLDRLISVNMMPNYANAARCAAFFHEGQMAYGCRHAPHRRAEGIGVDAEGNVHGAVVGRQMLEKHLWIGN